MEQLIDILKREINADTINDALKEADSNGEPYGGFDAKHAAACLVDRLVQELHCAICDGTGEVRDEDNADATLEDDGYRDTTPKINCALCGGTGFAFDVSTAFPTKLGVQTASPLTSTSSRGVVTTSPREAETPALSLDLQVTIDAVRLLNELLPKLALDGSIGYRLLDRAVDRLRASQTRLLTGEQELA